eukprot:s2052_g13.t1
MQHGEASSHGSICKLKGATLETAKFRIQCSVDSNAESTTRASRASRASSAAVCLKLFAVESCLAQHHTVAQRIGFCLLCVEQDLVFMPQVSVVKISLRWERASVFFQGGLLRGTSCVCFQLICSNAKQVCRYANCRQPDSAKRVQ